MDPPVYTPLPGARQQSVKVNESPCPSPRKFPSPARSCDDPDKFSCQDFRELQIPVQPDMQLEIASSEALAQGALIIAASSLLPCTRIPLKHRSASDNTP